MRVFPQSLTALAALTLVALAAVAERGDDADRKSKNGLAEGTVDGVALSIEYGRPNVNGREIFGGLVPFGEVWRTGANEATTIRFDAAVVIGGTEVPAGTYALFTLPGADEWQVMVNSVADQWGAFDYDASKDVATTTVPTAVGDFVETFEITTGDDGVTLRWAETAVTVPIEAAG